MNEQASLVTVRVNNKEKEFLEQYANQNGLIRQAGNPSSGMAIKQIIRHAMHKTHQGQSLPLDEKLDHITTLLEQVNVVIPHLLYHTFFTYKVHEGTLTDEKFSAFQGYSIKAVANMCGQIQKQPYKHIYISMDKKNMKTIPIEEENNQWK